MLGSDSQDYQSAGIPEKKNHEQDSSHFPLCLAGRRQCARRLGISRAKRASSRRTAASGRRAGTVSPGAVSRGAAGISPGTLSRHPAWSLPCRAAGLSAGAVSRGCACRGALPSPSLDHRAPCEFRSFQRGGACFVDAWTVVSPLVARPLRVVVEHRRHLVLVWRTRLSVSHGGVGLLLRGAGIRRERPDVVVLPKSAGILSVRALLLRAVDTRARAGCRSGL